MRNLRPLVLGLFAVFIPITVNAQNITITGTVRSETQMPVRGAFVTIPTLNLATVTNDVGFFRLTAPGTQAGREVTLKVTSIGYKEVERAISLRPGAVTYNVLMTEQAVALDEVIVTGTVGRQERRAQGAVVASISAAKLAETTPVHSIANLLQSRTPGVVLRNNSGSTGTSTTIRIRGQASIDLSNDPLVFIDGIRMQSGTRQLFGVGNQSGSALNDIKIEEIESIEVVKGPAAATLYGSDANAGVINIITKRGRQQSGFTQSITLEYGQADPNWSPPDNYGRCTAGISLTSFPACAGQPVGTVLVDNPLVREKSFIDGRRRNFAYNLRGGGERFGTFLSFAIDDEDGTLPSNDYGHVSGRANFDFFASEKVRLEMGFGMTRVTTWLPQNDNNIYGFLAAFLGDPRTIGGAKNGWYAPYRQTEAIKANENKDKTLRIQPRISLNYSPYSWFTNRFTFGGDLTRTRAYSFWPKNDIGWWDSPDLNAGQIGEARRSIDRFTMEYLGNVTRTLSSELRADVSFGSQVQTRKQDTVDATGSGLINNNVRTVDAAARLLSGGQDSEEDRIIGFFGQTQFSFRERLYVQVGGRVDQSSSFGADTKPFFSPKVSGSYVLSDEAFFQNLVPANLLNTLRLRAAYGVTGRSPTSGARSVFNPTTNQITATAVLAGVTPGRIGNPDIRAEKGKELEVGFEAGLLQDRLGLELTYFHKKTTDQILDQPLPGSTGFTGNNVPLVNVGQMLNRGFEIVGSARPLTFDNLALELRAAVNTLHNEVLDLGGTPESATRKVGFPISGVWNYVIRRVDVANNVTIVSDTLEFVGNSQNLPGWEGTLSGTLTLLKNLSFYVQADGRGDRIVFNSSEEFRDRQNGTSRLAVLGCAAFMPNDDPNCTDAAKEKHMRKLGCVAPCRTQGGAILYWQKENGDRLALGDVRGDYNEDGGFIKLREASVNYRIPRQLAERFMRVQSASLTFAMQNLHTWTDFTGFDPETDQFLTVPSDKRWTIRASFTF